MSHSFSLSLAAVDLVLEQLGLPRSPVPFEVPHVGTERAQRAMIREAVDRDLEARGLISRGRLDDDVELALTTFASAPVAIGAAAQLDDGPMFARAASDGRFAVLVRAEDNLLVFEEIRPTAVVPAIVDLIPLTAAAPGQSVTISRPGRRPRRPGAGDGYDPFANVAAPRAPSSGGPQVRAVERIFEQPKTRIGQFTAYVPGPNGRSVPLAPLAWFDTEAGRYLLSSRLAEDGQRWLTYAPADNQRLAQQLYSQLEGRF